MQVGHVQVFVETQRIVVFPPDRTIVEKSEELFGDFLGGVVDFELDVAFLFVHSCVWIIENIDFLDQQLEWADFDDHVLAQSNGLFDFDEGSRRRSDILQIKNLISINNFRVISRYTLVKNDDFVGGMASNFGAFGTDSVRQVVRPLDWLDYDFVIWLFI